MLARAAVKLPFLLSVPRSAAFADRPIATPGGRTFVMRTPQRTSSAPPKAFHSVDGEPTVDADTLVIDFTADSFDRSTSLPGNDPPASEIQFAVTWFLRRYRFGVNAPHIADVELDDVDWRVDYLNDDGTALALEEGLVRARGVSRFHVDFAALTPEIWDYIYSLGDDFAPPAWHTLMLDSRAEVRRKRLGNAVVLMAAAQEVFINQLLDDLARYWTRQPTGPRIDTEVWAWLNDREDDWQKQPSVTEQYTVLLKALCGKSLCEDAPDLWGPFRHLRTARNAFVHEGLVYASRRTREPLTTEQVDELTAACAGIFPRIREWIPEPIRWPAPAPEVTIETTIPLVREPSPPSADSDAPATQPAS